MPRERIDDAAFPSGASEHRPSPRPIDDPMMEGFRSQLGPINALADRSPGFVWRLQTEDGNAMAIRPFPDERMAISTAFVI